jgi:DNA-binding FrmR family transcriptional regulator
MADAEFSVTDQEAAAPAVVRNKALRDRLRRAEGQLRGVVRMLEEGRSCEEIITQLLAVRTAVDRAAAEILIRYMDECLASLPPERARETVARALKLLGKLS